MTNFFEPLDNDKPYFKVAMEGFAGSGKTYTAGLIAAGLHKRIESPHPVTVFDTEMASKYLAPLFKREGVAVQRKSSRSMADLAKTFDLLPTGSILLIDSISHVWENFLEAYRVKYKRTFMQFEDWGIIKPTWKQQFSEPLVQSPIHIIMTGRAGYEYDSEVNERTKKREIFKSGIKMKVEGETAYEPDILILMERFESVLEEKKEVWREATVLKDRSALLDGKTFKNPTYSDFAPAIDLVLADPGTGGARRGESSAGSLFQTHEEEERKRAEMRKRKEVALDKTKEEMRARWEGSTAEAKKAKTEALEQCFGTKSWKEVETFSAEAIETGLVKMLVLIHGQPPDQRQLPADALEEADWMQGDEPSEAA